MTNSALIVEDEWVIAADLQRILEELGWRVIGPAATVPQALWLLDSDPPSVAILDINLGRTLATPVAEELKARRIPFVLASARRNVASLGSAFEGITAIEKPFTEQKLKAAVEALLG